MQKIITNKKATFNYELLDTYEAGVVLSGYEVKALRVGKAQLDGAYVILRDGEAFLKNAHISAFQEANTPATYLPNRERKLLLSKKELSRFARELNTAGLTLVPLKWYNKNGKIKLAIALARGKKKVDKRETLKQRAVKRDIDRTLKNQ